METTPHWTTRLSVDHSTTKLGSRFHFRKLFYQQRESQIEFSDLELDFILEYLINETTLDYQPWWIPLATNERREVLRRLKLYRVHKDEETSVWFTAADIPKQCIALNGRFEACGGDEDFSIPSIVFPEGSIIGNLSLPMHIHSEHNGIIQASTSTSKTIHSISSSWAGNAPTKETCSIANWRRLTREQEFCAGIGSKYSKILITGPADYLIITSNDIVFTTSDVLQRLEVDNYINAFAIQEYKPYFRRKTFETGSYLVREEVKASAVYIIMEGECRAIKNMDARLIDQYGNLGQRLLLHTYTHEAESTNQIAIASLGTQSIVGDISVALDILEPVSVQAQTSVRVLELRKEDYKTSIESKRIENDHKEDNMSQFATHICTKFQKTAFENFKFILSRIEIEINKRGIDQLINLNNLRERINKAADSLESLGNESIHSAIRADPSCDLINIKSSSTISPTVSNDKSVVITLPSIVQHQEKGSKIKITIGDNKNTASVHESNELISRDAADAERDTKYYMQSTNLGKKHKNICQALLHLQGDATAGTNAQWKNTKLRPSDVNNSTESVGNNNVQLSKKNQRPSCETEICAMNNTIGLNSTDLIDTDSLFLFPTMTKQRQLHGRRLPLLPAYRGYET